MGRNASQGRIANYESGRNPPNREGLALLASALGVPVEQLVVDGGDPAAED